MFYTKSHSYMSKLSIHWLVAVMLSTFSWKLVKSYDFSYGFLSDLLSLCILTILWLQGNTWLAVPWFLVMPILWSDK
jgi:hypothetical protein